MRILLAIQAFFAVLFRGVIPPAALPAPDALPKDYLSSVGPSPADAAKLADLSKERDEAQAASAKLREELGQTKQSSQEASEKVASLGKELEAAQAQASKAEQDLAARSEEAEKLRAKVETLTDERDEALTKVGGARDAGALALLAWLQREGRLIDFLREEIDEYDDDQIGAAVRAIHKGCRKVLDEALELEPILPGEEESQVTVPEGFDPVEISLSGKVSGDPPFKGSLMHHGWRTAAVKIPVSETVDTRVLAPAEVEL